MMRSMFSGVSGMKNHLVRMDVMGNNIANVNTTGFKSSRVTFQDMLSQTLRTGTAPISGSAGGINPAQVGLGMIVGTVDTLQTQGNLGATGKSTDMAIQGEGFFVLSDNAVTRTYSRDGAFDIGQDGDLVNPANGYRLQGWMADINGTINITPELTSINIPVGQTEIAQATSSARLTGNINAVATSSTQGTVARSGKLYSDAGVTAAVGATFLTDLQDGATGTILSSGDI
ncbi:MAG: flagellar hook-basal body protein, partial [Candidatus Omnitrophota bacterium]